MQRDEDIVSYDFQGWPNYKMTLREILEGLGAVEENGMIGFKTDNPLLDVYPRTLEDDGMAYGVNEKYITEASTGTEKEEDPNYINFFIERKLEDPEAGLDKINNDNE